MYAISTNHAVRLSGRTIRKFELHTAVGFLHPSAAKAQMQRSFRLNFNQQLQEVSAMYVVTMANIWIGEHRRHDRRSSSDQLAV